MLEGKVIRIINDKTILINLGSEEGVKIGTKFAIIGPGEEIIEPETGKSLGPIMLEKARVVVRQVEPEFCRASTPIRTVKYPTSMDRMAELYASMAGLAGRTVRQQDSLPVDESDIHPLTEEASKVKVGDSVREVVELEE